MILETERLILRHHREENDAENLYIYACDPAVGVVNPHF